MPGRRASGGVGIALLLMAGGLSGQAGDGLAALVGEAEGSRVAFRFSVDPDVRVCENGFSRGGDDGRHVWGRWNGDRTPCVSGPLQVVLIREGRRIEDLDFGPVGSTSFDVDLGEVDSREASAFLLRLNERGASTDAAEEAMGAAVVARDAEPARRLLELGRDRGIDSELRRSALFWASQEAAEGIDSTLAGIASDAAEDQDVRDSAVFGLSQRPDDEAVPALMELARTAPHAQTRKSALFWLSQSDDDRVPDFFAELILGGRG